MEKNKQTHMSSETSPKQADEKFKISVGSAKDQLTRVQGAVARHAFSKAACSLGHEVEIWHRAKSELVRPLCHGQTIREDDIWVETNTGEFKEGTLEILVSPRHVTICGKPRNPRIGEVTEEKGSPEKNEIVFRTLELPVDVEPSAVTAKLSGPILEICFPKVHVKAVGQSGLGIAKTKPLALIAPAPHIAQVDL
jgi:hypothetical protein